MNLSAISFFDIFIRISIKGIIFSIPPNKYIFLSNILLIIIFTIFNLSEYAEINFISKLFINLLLLLYAFAKFCNSFVPYVYEGINNIIKFLRIF